MGWGRTFLLGDVGNRLDIADVETEVKRLKRRIADASDVDTEQDIAIEKLIYENAELKIYLAALIKLLIGSSVVSAEEIEELVVDLDASDGNLDGRYDGPIT